ncbi:MAG: GatB/YqeY domain-containing protein [Actinomycetia bacterium]|nr:GatB/YqeY domain-containing protein [Actinomycetes bacterium]
MDKRFIAEEITRAMKAHDKPRVSILRLVKNEIDTKEKESKTELADDEVLGMLKKVLRQTSETLEGSIKVGTDPDRTALLEQQVTILEEYLPEQVTGEELAAAVDRVLREGGLTQRRDMGKAINAVVAAVGGNCDKAEVARLVGERLR